MGGDSLITNAIALILLLSGAITIVSGQQFFNNTQFQPQFPFGTPFGSQQQPFQPNLGAAGGQSLINSRTPCIFMGDMRMIDRRAEDGWWNLYPFGERYNDIDMSEKPWKDLQIDLDFYYPFRGFRYNYTFIYPEGFLAFNRPQFIQPPYQFPHPKWPDEPDPSFIAAFLTEQSFAHIGETKISHVWYRVVTSPEYRFRLPELQLQQQAQSSLLSYPGRVEDPELLRQMTRHIRENMVGTRGFAAQFALIVTWERMGYGGQPKFLRLEQCRNFKKWLNTYQMVLVTEEIRSYVILNYAHINYTSSVAAGGWSGRGGRQSALVGFNGGNGTGFWELPYSAQGDSYKLVQYGSTDTAGRWLARVDESPQYGGCSNASQGTVTFDTPYINMNGGTVFNVSGPCFRPSDYITGEIDEEIFDCGYLTMSKATCVLPFQGIFKTGFVTIQIAQDGRNYAWFGSLYIHIPALGTPGQTTLVNSVGDSTNIWQPDWHKYDVDNLTLRWHPTNISTMPNSMIDISLFGYWEDVLDREFVKIGTIATGLPNTGVYSFNPKTLLKTDMTPDSWRRFWGGVVQVSVADHQKHDRGDRLVWSKQIPFGWYFHDVWAREYGPDWALQLCVEWFDYDGRRDNFMMELETDTPCPCTLNQAEADFGRFMPLPECDMHGDASCFYTKGAQHCIVAVTASVRGAAQVCCYDFSGWLMFSQDYEYNLDYLRYASAGVPYRAHPWGGYRYKKPPHVPSWSNFFNDLLPYDVCCRWAGRCEFYYWRRITSGCENYKPVVLGTVYGHGHLITFDNTKYTFTGRGYYNLVTYQSPGNELKIQIRTEQPPKTLYNTPVPATVITGVAIQANGSSLVQVFSRKEHRRWRYKTDLYVDSLRVFTDLTKKKLQHFNRVTVWSPHLNMNQSELHLMFTSGVGVKVLETNGYLQVIVALPSEYNETAVDNTGDWSYQSASRCQNVYRTNGLLGTYNGDPRDDLTNPTCQTLNVRGQTEQDLRTIFLEFGEKWRLTTGPDLLFDRRRAPLYYPLGWATNFTPLFDPWQDYSNIEEESLIFNRNTEVASTCQNLFSCEYDFLVTGRREDGLGTLSTEKKFEGLKQRGEQRLASCGPLQKNDGVLKFPIGNNYLDGVTVMFSCKVEYFLHGAPQRTCQNGTWSAGWWNWCRSRNEEHALKWMTGLVVTGAFVGLIAGFFYWLYKGRFEKRENWTNKVAPMGTVYREGKFAEESETEATDKEDGSVGRGETKMIGFDGQPPSPPQSIRSFNSAGTMPRVRRAVQRIMRRLSEKMDPPARTIVTTSADRPVIAVQDFSEPQQPQRVPVEEDVASSERTWSFSFFGRRPSLSAASAGSYVLPQDESKPSVGPKRSTAKPPALSTISESVQAASRATGSVVEEYFRPAEPSPAPSVSSEKRNMYTKLDKSAKTTVARQRFTESSF